MKRMLVEPSLKTLSKWVGGLLAVAVFGSGYSNLPASRMASVKIEQPAGASGFMFPKVDPAHRHMAALLENAFAYLDPKHDLVDAASGYLVEGWRMFQTCGSATLIARPSQQRE